MCCFNLFIRPRKNDGFNGAGQRFYYDHVRKRGIKTLLFTKLILILKRHMGGVYGKVLK